MAEQRIVTEDGEIQYWNHSKLVWYVSPYLEDFKVPFLTEGPPQPSPYSAGARCRAACQRLRKQGSGASRCIAARRLAARPWRDSR